MMRNALLLLLAVTAVFIVGWVSTYAYVSQNERDRYQSYTVAEDEFAAQLVLYLDALAELEGEVDWERLDPSYVSYALEVAHILAEEPLGFWNSLSAEGVLESARAVVKKQAILRAEEEKWEKACRLAKSVRWAGCACAGFFGMCWLITLAVWTGSKKVRTASWEG